MTIQADIICLVFWIATSIGCLATRNQTYVITTVLLFFMYLFGQFAILDYPKVLFGLHGGMFLIMLGLYQDVADKYTNRLLKVTFGMAITDAVFVMINIHIDWLHWILNGLYLSLCVVTMTGCWDTWKTNKLKRDSGNVHRFAAFSGTPISARDMGKRTREV